MKKIVSTLCTLPVLMTLSLTAHAQIAQPANAPVMRGEITTPVQNIGAADLLITPVAGVPAISASINNVRTIKTVTIPANLAQTTFLDVTLIDDFIDDVAPNARHYPTNFPTRTAEYLTGENLKHLSAWLEPYASAQDASYDVILRAAKINAMARNLNLGSDYAKLANQYLNKAVTMNSGSAEAQFLYGMMLSEAGAFNEAQKYLEKAASLGYVEAEQSMAQSDLLNDKKDAALSRLRALQTRYPDNPQIAEQVRIVENGGYYIWNIKDNDIHVKPISSQ